MTNLSERVMALSEPDREVDAEIAAVVRYFPKGVGYVWQSGLHPNIPEIGRVSCSTGLGTYGPHYKAPSYTASIDAAMALVPKGWCVWQMGEVPDNSPINWHVTLWQDGAINPGDCSQAATPALALCAAALLAREASNAD